MAKNVFILGDDIDGPHSTAIAVGPKAVLGCAHSLSFVDDPDVRPSRSVRHLKFNESYWVQSQTSRDVEGNFSASGRISISLVKFHEQNDWALFERTDGGRFDTYAHIEREESSSFVFGDAVVFHCPVRIIHQTTHAGEFTLSCNIVGKTIQSQSSHHATYPAADLVRGSSGGAVQLASGTALVFMHQEAIVEVEFDCEPEVKMVAETNKRVGSEDNAYEPFAGIPQTKKRKKDCESETVASLSGGNNGVGRALWLCKCKRLMHYVDALNSSSSSSSSK